MKDLSVIFPQSGIHCLFTAFPLTNVVVTAVPLKKADVDGNCICCPRIQAALCPSTRGEVLNVLNINLIWLTKNIICHCKDATHHRDFIYQLKVILFFLV